MDSERLRPSAAAGTPEPVGPAPTAACPASRQIGSGATEADRRVPGVSVSWVGRARV